MAETGAEVVATKEHNAEVEGMTETCPVVRVGHQTGTEEETEIAAEADLPSAGQIAQDEIAAAYASEILTWCEIAKGREAAAETQGHLAHIATTRSPPRTKRFQQTSELC